MPPIKRFDGADVRLVLLGMIMTEQIISPIAAQWTTGLFDNEWADLIGRWCVNHYREYHEPIGSNILKTFQIWASNRPEDEETIETIDRFLQILDTEQPEATPEYALDVAYKLFNQVRIRRECKAAIEEAEVGMVKEAQERIAELKSIQFSGNGHTPFRMHPMEFLTNQTDLAEPYRIEYVMAEGHDMIIVGPKKTLKTLICQDMAVAIFSGKPFLGKFQVNNPANVLFMSAESGHLTLKRNFRTIYEKMCGRPRFFQDNGKSTLKRLTPPLFHFDGRLELSDDVPKIADKGHLDGLRWSLEKYGARVLFIDTASKAMPGEQASNAIKNQELLMAVSEICKDLSVTFVLVHHTHKLKNPYRPLSFDDVLFSGFAEHFGQWIFVSRRKPYDPPKDGESRVHRLFMNVGGRAGHSGIYSVDIDEGSLNQVRWKTHFLSREEIQQEVSNK